MGGVTNAFTCHFQKRTHVAVRNWILLESRPNFQLNRLSTSDSTIDTTMDVTIGT